MQATWIAIAAFTVGVGVVSWLWKFGRTSGSELYTEDCISRDSLRDAIIREGRSGHDERIYPSIGRPRMGP